MSEVSQRPRKGVRAIKAARDDNVRGMVCAPGTAAQRLELDANSRLKTVKVTHGTPSTAIYCAFKGVETVSSVHQATTRDQ